jgi:hypothetical protein
VIGIIGDPRRDGQSSFETLIAYCEKDGRATYTGTQNINFEESAGGECDSDASILLAVNHHPHIICRRDLT